MVLMRYCYFFIALWVVYLGYCLLDPVLPWNFHSVAGKKVIIIGSTAGMGRETGRLLHAKGAIVGFVGRRKERLEELESELKERVFTQVIDVSSKDAHTDLKRLVDKMGGVDIGMICISSTASTRKEKAELFTEKDRQLRLRKMEVDLYGHWSMAYEFFGLFEKQGYGHLVGVSSIAAITDGGLTEYAAGKAFFSHYLKCARNKYIKNNTPIYVSELLPGYVDVEYEAPGEDPYEYWCVTPTYADAEIVEAIEGRKERAFIPRKWRIIGWTWEYLPRFLRQKIFRF